jgi:hypothetical protein
MNVAVDSNASCFNYFNSGSGSSKVAEFCLNLRLFHVITRTQASSCAPSSVHSLPCNNFVQKVVPQVKAQSLFIKAFKDFYVSLASKYLIIIPTGSYSPGPGLMLSHGIPKVYSSTLQQLPYLFKVWFTVFKPDIFCTIFPQLANFKCYDTLIFRHFLLCITELSLYCVRSVRTFEQSSRKDFSSWQ